MIDTLITIDAMDLGVCIVFLIFFVFAAGFLVGQYSEYRKRQ